jgi:hypothetical protein
VIENRDYTKYLDQILVMKMQKASVLKEQLTPAQRANNTGSASFSNFFLDKANTG